MFGSRLSRLDSMAGRVPIYLVRRSLMGGFQKRICSWRLLSRRRIGKAVLLQHHSHFGLDPTRLSLNHHTAQSCIIRDTSMHHQRSNWRVELPDSIPYASVCCKFPTTPDPETSSRNAPDTHTPPDCCANTTDDNPPRPTTAPPREFP